MDSYCGNISTAANTEALHFTPASYGAGSRPSIKTSVSFLEGSEWSICNLPCSLALSQAAGTVPGAGVHPPLAQVDKKLSDHITANILKRIVEEVAKGKMGAEKIMKAVLKAYMIAQAADEAIAKLVARTEDTSLMEATGASANKAMAAAKAAAAYFAEEITAKPVAGATYVLKGYLSIADSHAGRDFIDALSVLFHDSSYSQRHHLSNIQKSMAADERGLLANELIKVAQCFAFLSECHVAACLARHDQPAGITSYNITKLGVGVHGLCAHIAKYKAKLAQAYANADLPNIMREAQDVLARIETVENCRDRPVQSYKHLLDNDNYVVRRHPRKYTLYLLGAKLALPDTGEIGGGAGSLSDKQKMGAGAGSLSGSNEIWSGVGPFSDSRDMWTGAGSGSIAVARSREEISPPLVSQVEQNMSGVPAKTPKMHINKKEISISKAMSPPDARETKAIHQREMNAQVELRALKKELYGAMVASKPKTSEEAWAAYVSILHIMIQHSDLPLWGKEES